MASRLFLHPEAAAEIEEAIIYYRDRSYLAPAKLIEEYNLFAARVASDPTTFRKVYKDFRRLNLDRFPYALIFRALDDGAYLIAFIHERRRPHYWVDRIPDAPTSLTP